MATNWKLAVENYCESYHLPWVHPGLNSYSRLEDHYHIDFFFYKQKFCKLHRHLKYYIKKKFVYLSGEAPF